MLQASARVAFEEMMQTKTECCKRVWGCAVCCSYGEQRYIFSHYPSAYVGFIYIHGYPDNETFNPGDPAVRTMNPITSCRLWDGMVQSQTDGRGCSRPAIQSHSSPSLPCFPSSRVLQQLINRRLPRNLGSLRCGPTVLQTLICAIPEVHFTPAMFPPTTYTPEVSLFPHVWS